MTTLDGGPAVAALGRRFFHAIAVMHDASRRDPSAPGAGDAVAIVHEELERLFDALTAAVAPRLGPDAFGPRPTLARVREYVDKGGNRLDDSLRFFAGRWNRDIKLVVEVSPWGLSVFLTSWMAQERQSRGFAEFLDTEGAWARERLGELSGQLAARHGVRLHLQQSVRIGSHVPEARGWPEDDRDWTIWTANPVNQAGVGLWLWTGLDQAFVLDLARADELRAAHDAAGRVVGGAAGRELARRPEVPLEDAVAGAAMSIRGTWLRLMDADRLDEVARDVASGLAEILARFRGYMDERRVRPLAPVPFSAPAGEIAHALLSSANSLDARAASLALDVAARADSARVGWDGERRPWLQVARRPDGTIRLSFHADVGEGRYVGGLRPLIAGPLRGPEGDALLELIRNTGGTLAPQCGDAACRRRGRCPIDSRLVTHWLLSGRRPSLEWVIPSDGGDVHWLAAPAHLLTGLLLQVLPEPPRLTVPRIESETWDVFVSTPGRDAGFAGREIAKALRDEHLNPWYMEDHQQLGAGIDENTRAGILGSRVVVVVLHEAYWRSPYCLSEFLEAVGQRRPLVPVALTADGNAETAREQLPEARARLERLRTAHPGELIEAALASAEQLYGDTIRATLREGDGLTDSGALAGVAASVRKLLGRRP